LNSNAQKTVYIVTNNNDTIYGKKILYKKDMKGIKKGKEKIFHNIDSILGYYASSYSIYSYFEKVPSPHSWDKPGAEAFVRRVINGKIKMYTEPTQNGYYVYISKNNSKLVLIPTGQLKFRKKTTYEKLKKYIEDDPQILNELNTIGAKRIDFENLINKYNSNFKKGHNQ